MSVEILFENNEQAQQAYQTLLARGSLYYLSTEETKNLTPAILKWLIWAESHEGSEIVYQNEAGRARGIPVSSFLNYPEKYTPKIISGAFVSAELNNGSSIVLFFNPLVPAELKAKLAEIQNQAKPESVPIEQTIMNKMEAAGHLNNLSQTGVENLNTKLLKYLDYAVNIRPGSEIIYMDEFGSIRGDSLERALALPEEYEDIIKPVYLTIDIEEFSVVMDIEQVTPDQIIACLQQAYELAAEEDT